MEAKGEGKKWFLKGAKDGIPIGLGYFAVAFALGIAAKKAGMSAFEAGAMSVLMVASAGQYAAMAGFTNVSALAAATPLRSVLPCYMREALALLYYWVFKTSSSGPMHAMVGLLDLNKKFFYK